MIQWNIQYKLRGKEDTSNSILKHVKTSLENNMEYLPLLAAKVKIQSWVHFVSDNTHYHILDGYQLNILKKW